VPVPDLVGVVLGELERSVSCLGGLEARGEVPATDDVELVVGGNSVALSVMHGSDGMSVGAAQSRTSAKEPAIHLSLSECS
jgi:hypothetical protein